MLYDPPLVEATLRRRYKRFLADVELPDGQVVVAHCPNSGRMTGCWREGVPCRVTYQPSPRRKLDWTLEQTCMDGVWVMVHTGRTNQIVAEGLEAGVVPDLAGFDALEREVKHGDSRFDLRLRHGERHTWVEVKNVTLPGPDGAGRFPDAVSARARKHLHHLQALVEAGERAVAFFHVGRGDIRSVAPARDVDPAFGKAFDEARAAGVEMLAWASVIDRDGVRLSHAVPVLG